MSRNYKALLRSDGVYVPRWAITVFVFLVLLWFGLRILIPPHWIVQRLDSPDGENSAVLMRRQYLHQNLIVQLKRGWLWRTVFASGDFTNDYRVDLGERLLWDDDSRRLFLEVQDRIIWGMDVEEGRDLRREEMSSAELRLRQK